MADPRRAQSWPPPLCSPLNGTTGPAAQTIAHRALGLAARSCTTPPAAAKHLRRAVGVARRHDLPVRSRGADELRARPRRPRPPPGRADRDRASLPGADRAAAGPGDDAARADPAPARPGRGGFRRLPQSSDDLPPPRRPAVAGPRADQPRRAARLPRRTRPGRTRPRRRRGPLRASSSCRPRSHRCSTTRVSSPRRRATSRPRCSGTTGPRIPPAHRRLRDRPDRPGRTAAVRAAAARGAGRRSTTPSRRAGAVGCARCSARRSCCPPAIDLSAGARDSARTSARLAAAHLRPAGPYPARRACPPGRGRRPVSRRTPGRRGLRAARRGRRPACRRLLAHPGLGRVARRRARSPWRPATTQPPPGCSRRPTPPAAPAGDRSAPAPGMPAPCSSCTTDDTARRSAPPPPAIAKSRRTGPASGPPNSASARRRRRGAGGAAAGLALRDGDAARRAAVAATVPQRGAAAAAGAPVQRRCIEGALTELRRINGELAAAPVDQQRTRRCCAANGPLEAEVRRRAWHLHPDEPSSTQRPPAQRELAGALGQTRARRVLRARRHALRVGHGRRRGAPPAALRCSDGGRRAFRAAVRAAPGGAATRIRAVQINGAVAGLLGHRLDRLLLAPIARPDRRPALVLVPTGALHALSWPCSPAAGAARSRWRRPRGCGGGPPAAAAGAGRHRAGRRPAPVEARPGGADPGRRPRRRHRALRRPGHRAGVLAALDGAAVAHIACHGEFRADNPLFSHLQLIDGPLTVYDLSALRRPPSLLVLSACDAGLSAVHPGDELQGLSTALLGLGASAVVASLGPVDDVVAQQHDARLPPAAGRRRPAIGRAGRRPVHYGRCRRGVGWQLRLPRRRLTHLLVPAQLLLRLRGHGRRSPWPPTPPS